MTSPAEDQAGYRIALGQFPTGVAFVASRSAEGVATGLLINSFTSVSLTPPLVLWCLAASSRSRPVFANASTFAVSVLSQQQKSILASLARPAAERLAGVPVRNGLGGAPILEAASAAFECSTVSITQAGDHDVFMGRVERFERCERPPLAFLAGEYGHVDIAQASGRLGACRERCG